MVKSLECCPKFNPELWDEKIFEWKNKKFIKGRIFTFFYIPLNFGSVIKKLMKKIDAAEAKVPDWMGLSDHTSKWSMDILVMVDREIPGAKNILVSGKFFSKAYEGDFKDTGKWMDDYKQIATKKGVEVEKHYMWYTTCPKCAKKYGKNYTVIVGKIKD